MDVVADTEQEVVTVYLDMTDILFDPIRVDMRVDFAYDKAAGSSALHTTALRRS